MINPEDNKLFNILKQISEGIASAKIPGFGTLLQSSQIIIAIDELVAFLNYFKSNYNLKINEKKIVIEMELEKKIQYKNELKNDLKNEQSTISFSATSEIKDFENDQIETIDIRNQNNYSSDSGNSNEKLKPIHHRPSKIDSISSSLSIPTN